MSKEKFIVFIRRVFIISEIKHLNTLELKIKCVFLVNEFREKNKVRIFDMINQKLFHGNKRYFTTFPTNILMTANCPVKLAQKFCVS